MNYKTIIFGLFFSFFNVGIIFNTHPMGDTPNQSTSINVNPTHAQMENDNTANNELKTALLTKLWSHVVAIKKVLEYEKALSKQPEKGTNKSCYNEVFENVAQICFALESRRTTPFNPSEIYNIVDDEGSPIPFNTNPNNLNLPMLAIKLNNGVLLKECAHHLPNLIAPNHPHNTYALKKCSKIMLKKANYVAKLDIRNSNFENEMVEYRKSLESLTGIIHFLGNGKE